ncbi:MAG: amidohydrolase [Chitinophagaceae bacterium]|nr:amidohydrolase [Chitinophagaceae bacterium]
MSPIDPSFFEPLVNASLEEIISFRHHIHSHPELSFQEIQTSAFVSDKLTSWGISHTKGLGALEAGQAGTGIVAIIQGKNPESRVVALRSDLDALPITEINPAGYCSQNKGVMHACGHDVHTSCLLGAAKILQETREHWEGTVKLIFQPGEEKHPGGASLMIRDQVLDNPKPQAIFALHVYPHLPYGKVGYRAGQYMASADEIYITIKGKGGHAALPHQTIDPIVMAANVLLSLQQIISRSKNPLTPSVLSFGQIHGGNAGNVIPDEVRIEGTLRCMDETWRAQAHELIKNHTIDICRALGGDAVVEIPKGYPSLFNHPETTLKVKAIAEQVVGAENVVELDLRMAAEDFSFYTHEVPGCFFRIGTSHEGQFTYPVHNAHFDIYEQAIGVGVKMFCAVAAGFDPA